MIFLQLMADQVKECDSLRQFSNGWPIGFTPQMQVCQFRSGRTVGHCDYRFMDLTLVVRLEDGFFIINS